MANLPPFPPLPLPDHFPPPPPTVPNLHFLSPFYYGLVVVGSAAIVLTIYNLIIVGFCPPQRFRRSSPQNSNGTVENTLQRCENCTTTLVSTFKYKKGEIDQEQPPLDNECVVCLSGFEEGEDVRQLVQCKHSFHAICIDKWLCSHSDCPLCRTIVRLPVCRFVSREENSTRDSSVPTISV